MDILLKGWKGVWGSRAQFGVQGSEIGWGLGLRALESWRETCWHYDICTSAFWEHVANSPASV